MGRKKVIRTLEEIQDRNRSKAKKYYWSHKKQCNIKTLEYYYKKKEERQKESMEPIDQIIKDIQNKFLKEQQ